MNKPKLFDFVKAWNDDKNNFIIGCYLELLGGNRHLIEVDGMGAVRCEHAVKVPHELAEQLRKLDECAEEVSENG